ncbi:MAG: deoxyguanosinetriphosphate triphosphohydrolase [Oscillospiraceae bacterium]|nr:deoxyguanosinetriphosphate triphosphohydrolase [Oscillospiraceae bacterium]
MTVREQTEAFENNMLCQNACHAAEAVRDVPEPLCPLRTEFQRDRDRILHCTSFRRLKRKTQVFLSPIGDHYRTRLTHTLEVAQIARTMARALRMNEDLTEAIALGHDLGHSPFGHAGEAALNAITPGGYRHYEQSVRVVERIEKHGRGLNLTRQVRDGILCHTNMTAATREGNLVRLADRIAYINHDIDDAIRGGILREEDLPADCTAVLGHSKSKRITTMITSVIEHGDDVMDMMPDIRQAHDALHTFLYQNIYSGSAAKTEDHKAQELIRRLYAYYLERPEEMPAEYRLIAEKDTAARAVCDYIAGMSDDYAIWAYEKLFIPRSWDVK